MDPNEAFSRALALGYRLDQENPAEIVWYDPQGVRLAAFSDYKSARGWMAQRLDATHQ